VLSDITAALLPVLVLRVQRDVICRAQVCHVTSNRSTVMQFANSLRLVLLGGLIITGIVVYQDREARVQGDPNALTSLRPSPVTVTVLTEQNS
jgi:hypothetical protein